MCPSVETIVGHAPVIAAGVIAPPRTANVRPVIIVAIALQPPWGGIPPSAIVIRIALPTVPVSSMVCSKNSHPSMRVSSGRMLPKSGMRDVTADDSAPCCPSLVLNRARADAVRRCPIVALHGVRYDAVLPRRCVMVLQDAWADAVVRCCSVKVLNASRAQPGRVHHRPPIAAIKRASARAARARRSVRHCATAVTTMVRVPRRRHCREGKSTSKNGNRCEPGVHGTTLVTSSSPLSTKTETARHACVEITPF